jgi:hypothetical protein
MSEKIRVTLDNDKPFMELEIDPDVVYTTLLLSIRQKTTPKGTENATAKRLSQLLRVSLKGGLLLYGDTVLDLFYGSKEHPHVPRSGDVLDFYAEQLTCLVISWLLRQHIVLKGVGGEVSNTFEIHSVKVTPKSEVVV